MKVGLDGGEMEIGWRRTNFRMLECQGVTTTSFYGLEKVFQLSYLISALLS